ncbi:protein phosphatase-like protein 2c [Lophiotrema nucula]|uniref:Protein phosphatase-like protein 2c n=1 Tax=Lophiotrema nucula TaxID=690887 RepID=A0A6A5ZKQ7_9PLEO|nr:protein phosphatase-like protein 2c [Lophiotrema nucula]
MWKPSVRLLRASRRPSIATCACTQQFRSSSCPPRPHRYVLLHRRLFHDYFLTHLPSSSLHPDSRSAGGPHHKLPRDKSTPHVPRGTNRAPAAAPPMVGLSREMTVLRIPIIKAKHHFGVCLSRGIRPYNEDAFQAGTIDIPAFAKRRPISLTRNPKGGMKNEATPAGTSSGDPEVFYFGVFDGHGGTECSMFLRERLHDYIEKATQLFELESSLRAKDASEKSGARSSSTDTKEERSTAGNLEDAAKDSLEAIQTHTPEGVEPLKPPQPGTDDQPPASGKDNKSRPMASAPALKQSEGVRNAEELERNLLREWKEMVGGYFRRFKPEYFSMSAGGRGHPAEQDVISKRHSPNSVISDDTTEGIGIETVLQYSFLKADYDFVSAQVGKQDEDPILADRAINDEEVLGHPSRSASAIGGSKRFKGGSTCSIALISTPTPSPFWHPASPSTLITAHVGDTRILLCNTATGLAIPLTSNHHPSLPEEATRLRRYAAAFVTDSFGEERVSGLANTRAFGDMASKRIGVSAEPEIRRIEVNPAEYSFMVMISDGVSGHLSDQEIVDVVKEEKTPHEAAQAVTKFATETSTDADNATTLVVRLGGWERRSEGGLGSMGTKEMRDWRKAEAENPRGRM